MFGFTGSSLTRTVLGAGFCILAGGLVWAVERPRAAAISPIAAVSKTPASQVTLPLVIESTYAVTDWLVMTDGVRSEAGHSTAWTWSGMVSGVAGGEVLVVAAAPAGDSAPNRCLRLRLDQAEPVIVWGGGDVTATLAIP